MGIGEEEIFLACSLLKKQEDEIRKFSRIFCLRAINDTTHDALATHTHRREKRTARCSNSPEEIRVKKDDSIVRNIETAIEKEELDTTSKLEQEEESFENRLATTGKLSGERGGERVTRRRGARARDLLNVLRSNGTVFFVDFRSHRRLLARFPFRRHVILKSENC